MSQREIIRFWKVQSKRLQRPMGEPPHPFPLFDYQQAVRTLDLGRHALSQAISSLVSVGPLYTCSDEELRDLCEEIATLTTAAMLELSTRPGYRLQLMHVTNDNTEQFVNWFSVCESD